MTRIERERHQDLSDVVDRQDVFGPDCGAVVLATTTTLSAYPTTAGAFYAANPTEIDGDETEGAVATYTADSSQVIYILNQGTQVPPIGTRVIAHCEGAGGCFGMMAERLAAEGESAGKRVRRVERQMKDSHRQLHARHIALAGTSDRVSIPGTVGTVRRLVQIYSGGALPASADRFYLSHPVELDGTESEGKVGAATVDATQTIPVVVLGRAPSVGDVLPAFSVGGRWVAERGGNDGQSLVCSPCLIPARNLTISWVNSLTGNGSDTLVYSAVGPTWTTGCSGGAGVGNKLLFKLYCTGGTVELRVFFFVTGACPDGETEYCSNLQSPGSQLTLNSYVCDDGFTLAFTLTELSCPAVSSSGFTGFIITL